MPDIVVLTDERYVAPTERNQYIDNVMYEDELVMEALRKEGFEVVKVAWSDPNFEWRSVKYALFRTTWDYAERFKDFADWLMDVSLKTRLINSYDLISWNLDKHYMNDLKKNSVNVVETYFVEPKDERSLAEIHDELGWEITVIKPAVSAAAKDTFKLSKDNIKAHEETFKELIKNESMMIQPFQNSVLERGELSLMVVNGEFTHAVQKIAKPGDFRVQDDYGGTVQEFQPTQEEIDLALKASNSYDHPPVYARVDILNDNNGDPAVSELELIEPEMWFRNNPKAAEKLATSIAAL